MGIWATEVPPPPLGIGDPILVESKARSGAYEPLYASSASRLTRIPRGLVPPPLFVTWRLQKRRTLPSNASGCWPRSWPDVAVRGHFFLQPTEARVFEAPRRRTQPTCDILWQLERPAISGRYLSKQTCPVNIWVVVYVGFIITKDLIIQKREDRLHHLPRWISGPSVISR